MRCGHGFDSHRLHQSSRIQAYRLGTLRLATATQSLTFPAASRLEAFFGKTDQMFCDLREIVPMVLFDGMLSSVFLKPKFLNSLLFCREIASNEPA